MADDNNTEKTFTQADIDALKEQHQKDMDALAGKLRAEFKDKEAKAKAEAEKLAKQSNMSELEKANSELNEYKTKYQEAQDQIALTAQKDDTRKMMSEMGVDEGCLDYVFVPKDVEATKARIKSFKEYVDNVKKTTFESNVQSTAPGAGSQKADDAALRKAFGL